MTPSALSVTRLTKRFGSRLAVDDLTLEVPAGVVAGFVGPNGAGKTTTMAMLLGLVRPTAGTGTVLGYPLDQPARYLPHVGALIETPAFYPALSGARNLEVFAIVGRHDPDRIPALLELVGLEDRGDDPFRSYSLGMKQRLGIAAAMLGDPRLLILDEPSNGLDPQGMREMREIITRVAADGRTVLVSSHVLSELEQICDWLIMIERGAVLYAGAAADFVVDAVTALTISTGRSSDLPVLQRVLSAAGHQLEVLDDRLVAHVDDDDLTNAAAEVNRAAFEAGLVLTELSTRRTTLQDRYLTLVDGSVG
ncbi:MAG: type transport system ATP-binding protein [Actinomycetota bacterium]|jgi:ABC-2 type transport system ATP-binding protein|nr:type transport system ATP-binding protein [Actinomycetota bacterium]